MSIESAITALVTQAIATASTAQNAVIADLSRRLAALEKGVGPTQAPPPAPPPGQSVTWRDVVWSVVNGRILANGATTTETAQTAGVTRVWVEGDNLLHETTAGDTWAYTGRADWKLILPPTLTIVAAGDAA